MRNIFIATVAFFTFHFSLFTFAAHAATVSRIDVTGNRRMDAQSVQLLADVKIGQNINSEDTNQIAKKLAASGLFENSSVVMDGNVMKIRVTESAVVSQVTVEGNDAVDTSDLKKEIRLKDGANYDIHTIGGDVQRMLSIYQRQGYFGTKINPKKITLDNSRVNVVYEITEGHPTYISDITFSGNETFSARDLRGALLSREHAWWKFMATFDTYDEDRIQYDAQMLRQFYMRNGFADMRVKKIDGVFSDTREFYSVKFEIEEGARFHFGEIKITNPFDDVDDDELNDALAMRTGDVYNIDDMETTIQQIRSTVATRGYAFINVDPVMDKNDDKKTIGVNFKIQKTARIYIGKLNILGNVRTFDSVIEQQMQIRAGDPFSLQEIESARQRMMRTQFYKSVDMTPARMGDSNQMILDVNIEEQPTGQLSGAVGWSNLNGFMIDAGIAESNFMGRGQNVSLRATWAQYQRNIGFSFTEPYLFDRALSGGFDVQYTQYNYSKLGSFGYDRDSFVVAGRLGWKLTEHWAQTMRASAMFDQNYDLHVGGGFKESNLYTVGTNFRYHNLDTDFAQQTHTGVIANFGIAYTGFGISTEEFMRYDGDVTAMYKFFDNRWQIMTRFEGGALQSLDDGYIGRVYRYFLGGESLRGFELAGVGSRNWYYDTYALGGLWKAAGSTQINFPVFIPDEYQVKGFVFADYGILGKPPKQEFTYTIMTNTGLVTNENYIDNNLRMSVGVGVYWNTPMGPMNFSWGWPILKESYDREQRFLLSFATQF